MEREAWCPVDSMRLVQAVWRSYMAGFVKRERNKPALAECNGANQSGKCRAFSDRERRGRRGDGRIRGIGEGRPVRGDECRMKYDLLEPFREYLYDNLSSNTARKYYAAIVKLFNGINMNRIEDVSLEYLEREIVLRFKTRNEFSAAKNGLKWLAEFYPQLRIPGERYFKSQSMKKRNFSKKPGKVIYLGPTLRKINQLTNEKLKYAYRLALVSGLRVSELADLEASDITFEEGTIIVQVRNGKGGHGGTVRCRDDPYLYEHLQQFIAESEKNPSQKGKLFYGEAKMRKEALRLGFECHDLRRIYAILTRKELRRQMPAREADRMVQQNMRHVRFSTTKRYLYNRKLKMEYEHGGGKARKPREHG